jgi:SEC-C motif domain protein
MVSSARVGCNSNSDISGEVVIAIFVEGLSYLPDNQGAANTPGFVASMPHKESHKLSQCSCGSGKVYGECCGPIIAGTPAPTAEALMRSRFTAFARGNLDHIERTCAKVERGKVETSGAGSSSEVEWVGLQILDTIAGGTEDDTGIVEFAARYRSGDRIEVHRERSNFCREDGQWVYVDGVVTIAADAGTGKIGRNDPCPCGSGKKYKKCCGA